MEKIKFLFFSSISGLVEVGFILFGIYLNLSIEKIILLGLAYQLGNCVPNPIKLNKKGVQAISIIGLVSTIMYKVTDIYTLLFISAMCLAISIQSIRSVQKGKVKTWIKRSFRIIGFILSFTLNIWTILAIYIITILSLISINFTNSKILILKPKIKFINIIMIVHQIHYFLYCYFIVLLIGEFTNDNAYLIGILFALGWLTYSFIPQIVRGTNYKMYLVIGHIYLTIILAMLSFANGFSIIVFWLLTGFGSGTVYCISKVDEEDSINYDESSMTFSENIGHVVGILFGLILYLITNNLRMPIYFAVVFAFSTAVLMLIYNSYWRGYKNDRRK